MINLGTDGGAILTTDRNDQEIPYHCFFRWTFERSRLGVRLRTMPSHPVREDLIEECGDELSKVLEHFRLVSFESSSR